MTARHRAEAVRDYIVKRLAELSDDEAVESESCLDWALLEAYLADSGEGEGRD